MGKEDRALRLRATNLAWAGGILPGGWERNLASARSPGTVPLTGFFMTSGPKLLFTGKPAIEKAAALLATASPITVPSNLGDVQLQPGTIFSNNKMLIWPTASTVYYTIDDRLYEYGTSDFIRAEYLNALSAGATRAMPMVYMAKAEVALLTGIFVPWYGMLGLTAAKLGLAYSGHKKEFDIAFRKAPVVLRMLQDLRRRYPVLFSKLARTAAWKVLADLPHGVTSEDVAFFVGRVLKGIGGAPDVTLGAVVRIMTSVALIVGALHSPSIAAHGVAWAAEHNALALKEQLARQGIHVSKEEADTILREVLSKHEGIRDLQQLAENCRELIPLLKQLAAAIHED